MQEARARTVGLLALLLVVVSCASGTKEGEEPAPGTKATRTTSPPYKPPAADPGGWDWLQLTSDEWLKGEIKWMRDYTLLFDSDELDDLTIKWRKVKVLKSPKTMATLRDELEELEEAVGTLHIEGGKVVIGTKDSDFLVFDRDSLISIVPGGKGESSYWSGGIDLGMTLRTGNTDQIETTLGMRARRRTPRHRITFDYMGNYGEINSVENVNNQRFTARWDVSISRRWFVTPIGLEIYRDPFQNVALRTTPVVGLGYHLLLKGVDKKGADWNITGLVGYRATTLESGADGTDTTATVGFSTGLEWDVNEKLELDLDYLLSVSVSDPQDTNQNLTFKLSYDAFKDFDLDFSIVWNFVGAPQPNENGIVPENADTRFIFGIGWEF